MEKHMHYARLWGQALPTCCVSSKYCVILVLLLLFYFLMKLETCHVSSKYCMILVICLLFYFLLKLETSHSPEFKTIIIRFKWVWRWLLVKLQQFVSMTVNNNNLSWDLTHTEDHVPSNCVIPALKSFLIHGTGCEYEQYHYF